MLSWNKGDDRVAIAQMNSELRNAQLELLSAQCATDRLRLRFSAEEVARYGQRDVVRKAVESATALQEYYGNIAHHFAKASSAMPVQPIGLAEENVDTAVALVRQYLEEQRRKYFPQGSPLDADQHIAMSAFFPCALLPGIRIVQNESVADPGFYEEARGLGVTGLPEMTHMESMTFDDVLVFPRGVTDRRLFHALVHVVQFKVLGLERYSELFVRSFLRTRNHASVPLEMHAFALEAKFAENPAEAFCVEESVRLWVNQHRY